MIDFINSNIQKILSSVLNKLNLRKIGSKIKEVMFWIWLIMLNLTLLFNQVFRDSNETSMASSEYTKQSQIHKKWYKFNKSNWKLICKLIYCSNREKWVDYSTKFNNQDLKSIIIIQQNEVVILISIRRLDVLDLVSTLRRGTSSTSIHYNKFEY